MTMPGATIRRVHEERRPKNGVHKDQTKRNHTRANRRAEKQQLRREYR